MATKAKRRRSSQEEYLRRRVTSFLGLNTEHPTALAENELVTARNVEVTLGGKVRPRVGALKRFATDFDASPVLGMSALYKSDGTTRLVMAAGTSLYADNPHVTFNYDAQADWKKTGVYTNLDADSSPGDLVLAIRVLDDGFEGGTFSKWTSADSGWAIDTTVYKTGAKSAKGTGTAQKLVYDFSAASSSVYVRLAVRFAETDKQHFPVIFKSLTDSEIQAVVADSGGSFKYHNGTALSAFPVTKSYAAGTWYVVEVWVRNGTFWVSVDGQSLTPDGLAMKDTNNAAQSRVSKYVAQNAGTAAAATTWLDDVYICPSAAVFSRSSAAYKSDGTQVAANQPRYEYGALSYPVWQDTFDTNQLSQYTSGGDTPATWAVSGGVLTGTGGTQATLIKKDLSLENCTVVVNSDQAGNGGIVARYQDNSNYYLLTFVDNGGSSPASSYFKNPNFDVSVTDNNGVADWWTGAGSPAGSCTFSLDTSTKYSGTQSQKIIHSKGSLAQADIAIVSQRVACGAGVALTFGGYFLCNPAQGGCVILFRIKAFNSSGTLLGQQYTEYSPVTNWTYGSVSYTTPTGTASVSLEAVVGGAGNYTWSNVTTWFDNCSVSGITTAGQVPRMQLLRRAGGTFTALGGALIDFPRDTSKQIKFTLHGSRLEAYFDGARVISVTDTTFTGGGVGLRNNSTTTFRALDFTVHYAQQAVMVEEGTANLLTNPGFESGDTGWTKTYATIEQVAGWQGSWRGRMNLAGTEPEHGRFYQTVAVAAEQTYTLSAYVKRLSGGTPSTSLIILWKDSGGNTISQVNSPNLAASITGDWKRFSVTATAPTGAASANVYCYISRGEAVDIVWDAVQFENKPYATSFTGGTRSPETLTTPTTGVISPQEGTVEFWAWLPDGPPSYLFSVLGNPDNNNNRLLIYGSITGSDNQSMQAYIGTGSGYVVTPAISVTRKEWHYYACRWTATELKLTVDNTTVSASRSGVCTFGSTAYIGSSLGWNQSNALINNLRISSRARTDAEVAAVYQSGLPLEWDVDTTYLLPCDGNLNLPAERQGVWVSPAQDGRSAVDKGSLTITWDSVTPQYAALSCQVRTSSDGASWSLWYDQVNGEASAAPANNYSQVRFIFQTADGFSTPRLRKMTAFYDGQSAATAIATGLGVAPYYSFAQLSDSLVICSGDNIPKKYDGQTVQNISAAPYAYLAAIWRNRVFMAKTSGNRSRLYASDMYDVTSWPAANFWDVNPNDGDEIMCLLAGASALLVIKQHRTYYVQGDSPDNINISPAGEGGTISPWGAIWTPRGVFLLDREGVWATDFRRRSLLTTPIKKVWDDLDERNLHKGALFYWGDRLLVSVPHTTLGRVVLVYDMRDKDIHPWTVWTGWAPSCFLAYYERNKWTYLFGSSSVGNVFQIGDADNDAGAPFTASIETAHTPLVSEEWVSRLRWLDVYFGGGGVNGYCDVAPVVDGLATSATRVTVPGNAEAQAVRVFPPPWARTVGVRVDWPSTGHSGPVFLGLSLTYYPRAPRPERVL